MSLEVHFLGAGTSTPGAGQQFPGAGQRASGAAPGDAPLELYDAPLLLYEAILDLDTAQEELDITSLTLNPTPLTRSYKCTDCVRKLIVLVVKLTTYCLRCQPRNNAVKIVKQAWNPGEKTPNEDTDITERISFV